MASNADRLRSATGIPQGTYGKKARRGARAPQTRGPRAKGSQRRSPSRRPAPGTAATTAETIAAYRAFGPTNVGKNTGDSIGTLEAEFFGCMLLVGFTIFTDPKASSDYDSVMLAAMKRGTLVIITFFLLALLSASGPNAARLAKAFGALIVVALIMAQAENGFITIFDSFVKADWSTGGSKANNSSAEAQAGQQSPGISAQDIESALGDIGTAIGEATAKAAAGETINRVKKVVTNPVGTAEGLGKFVAKFPFLTPFL